MGETNKVEISLQENAFEQHGEIMHKPYIISSFTEDLGGKASLSSTVAFRRAQSETEEEWEMKGAKRGMRKPANEAR